MTKEDGDRWQLNDQDRSSIKDLIRAVRSLTPAAMSGDCLIGLGEVWAALEGILDDSEIEINVQLEVGFRSGNADFDEGPPNPLPIFFDEGENTHGNKKRHGKEQEKANLRDNPCACYESCDHCEGPLSRLVRKFATVGSPGLLAGQGQRTGKGHIPGRACSRGPVFLSAMPAVTFS